MVMAPTAISPPYLRREELKHINRTLSVICIIKGEAPRAIEFPRILRSGTMFEMRSFKMLFLPHRKETTQHAEANCEIIVARAAPETPMSKA